MALPAVLLLLALAGDDRARRLAAVQDEMRRLQGELTGLVQREKTLLGDVARMDAEIALRRAEAEEVSLRLSETEDRLAASARSLAEIGAERDRRAPQLAARLREIYKRGPLGLLSRVLGTQGEVASLDGLRYAALLARRDAAQLQAWRGVTDRLAREREGLDAARERYATLESESARKEAALTAGRASRSSLLARVRDDREQHERAVTELEDAARRLGQLVASVEDGSAAVALDVRKFRGLLDWPADGAVSATFGTTVHPRFKTEVPHPGLDIDAAEGEPIRAVFDGRVAFAAPLAGYGLTCVLDHGHGVVSIYAHAQVLLAAAGETVVRGQEIGKVGDSGSLRGTYLYFEMRDAGKPVDPSGWLRPR